MQLTSVAALLAIASALNPRDPMARRAHRLAGQLEHPHDRDVDVRADALIAELAGGDALALYPEDGLLDPDFDL